MVERSNVNLVKLSYGVLKSVIELIPCRGMRYNLYEAGADDGPASQTSFRETN